MTWKGKWPGTWATICDVCGLRFPSDKLMKRWDGLMTCKDDWELRHPQDFIKIRPEKIAPDWVRNDHYMFRESRGANEIVKSSEDFSIVYSAIIPIGATPSYSIHSGAVDETGLNAFALNADTVLLDYWNGDFSNDSVFTTDNAIYQLINNPYVADTVTTSESFANSVSTSLADSSTTSDTIKETIYNATQLNGSALGILSINSSNLITVTSALTDSATSSDSVSNSFSKSLVDATNTSDSVSQSFTSVETDSTTTSETTSYKLYTLSQLNGLVMNGARLNGN
ncbi:MAG TPA: hypothetical protein VFM18_16315 [Methanosarcina sp.]|nr:hypothetical protein [Methanosarcina sp.]